MSSLRDSIRYGVERLLESGIDNAEYDAFALLECITGFSRTDYLVRGAIQVGEADERTYKAYIERRCAHEPLQHITGKAYFYKREYVVNKNVLVPRFDTEILVEQALTVIRENDSVLDMCTGSGCIIITLALEKKLAAAVGADVSGEALEVARLNRQKLGANMVRFVESDLFSGLDDDERYDVIVSNPPYIETEVIKGLDDEVKLFDPMLALDGHEDGLFFYRAIVKSAAGYLNRNGWLLLEIGFNQAESVSHMMLDAGFAEVKTVKDYQGHDRVVMGRLAV